MDTIGTWSFCTLLFLLLCCEAYPDVMRSLVGVCTNRFRDTLEPFIKAAKGVSKAYFSDPVLKEDLPVKKNSVRLLCFTTQH